jgi:hypothetical protein
MIETIGLHIDCVAQVSNYSLMNLAKCNQLDSGCLANGIVHLTHMVAVTGTTHELLVEEGKLTV